MMCVFISMAVSLMITTTAASRAASTDSHLYWKSTSKRPIIGIVAIDTKSIYGKSFIPATYVKYLEQAGARVVPIRGGQSVNYYDQMVNFTNGILFPGGAVNFNTSDYGKSVSHIFKSALKINEDGDYYPLWGTCMGFQIMCYRVQGSNLLKPTDSDNASWPLELLPGYDQSRMFHSAPKDIIKYLSTEPTTQNQHSYSIWLEVFQNSKLSSFFNALSINTDRKGQHFISTAEAKNYPFYGVQWHPEKNNFNWNPNYVINHDSHAVDISQYMADFFISEARRNGHRFPNLKMEAENLIQNYKRIYRDDGTFSENYYIPV